MGRKQKEIKKEEIDLFERFLSKGDKIMQAVKKARISYGILRKYIKENPSYEQKMYSIIWKAKIKKL